MSIILSNGSYKLVTLKNCQGVIGVAHIRSKDYHNNPYNLASLKRGTGGRSSFNGIIATVFGASGFIGRYVCNRLGKTGTQLIIPYRGDHYDVIRLKLCGDLGQVLFQPFDLRDQESIDKAVRYSNVVVNLIGRDWETKNFKFEDVHVKGAEAIARAAKNAGVQRLIHLSALNAEKSPPPIMLKKGSQFLASKYRGEQAVLKEFPTATIFRPADVYGQEDRFLRYYSNLWRKQLTFLPLWKKGEATVKQPVHVSDLTTGIVNAIKNPDTAGKIFQAIGPKRYYLSDLVDWFHRIMKRDATWGYRRYDLRYDPIFQMRISINQAICPGFPIGNLHWERIERESISDKINPKLCTLEDLGVTLMHMENQVPWELKPWMFGLYHDRDLEDFGVRPEPPPVVTERKLRC